MASKLEVVTKALAAREYGDLFPYGELVDLTGSNKSTCQGLVRRACKTLLREHQKTVVCEPNRGYRIAQPEEHVDIALHHHKKGRRQVGHSLLTLRGTNRGKVSPEVLRRLDELEEVVSAQQSMLRRMTRRQSEMEKHLAGVAGETDQNRESLDDLSHRFHELEARLEAGGLLRNRRGLASPGWAGRGRAGLGMA
jgi:hypothetical protein